ncbi:MAG: PhoU domain-containing protein, partial [Sedimentisphaerales bacterium]
SADTTACLLLMSVVKDAERLGDYAKNLLQVTEYLEKPIDKALFMQYFDGVDQDLVELFENTKRAFIETDLDMANLAWDYHKRISKGCDEIVKKVAQSDLTVNEAVCFALIARYFKRVGSHLTNIATSVVLPLSDLDYFDEKRKVE